MQFLKLKESDSVVEVVLNRPDLRNALNPEMISEITSTFKALAKRSDIRAVVLRGEGKSFCSGADLNWMKSMVNLTKEENKKDADLLFEMFQSIAVCPHFVLGLIRGAVYGGALGLVACCDWVLAEESSTFCFSEVRLGLAPAVISHFVLKKIPVGFVSGLMMTGRPFGIQQANAMGLIHNVGKETDLEKMVNEILNQVGEVAHGAVRETKDLVMKVGTMDPSQARAHTTELIANLRVGPEGQEGLRAFLEKRAPSWKASWKVR